MTIMKAAKKVKNQMNLLEFLKSEAGLEKAIHIEEYDGQAIVYIDAIEIRDAQHKRNYNSPDYFGAILERFISEHFGEYEETEYLDETTIKILQTIQISIDEEVRNYCSSTKYPYYEVTGQLITSAEKEKIQRNCNLCHLDGLFKSKDKHEILNTSKYPNIEELLKDILDCLIEIPKLDIQITFSECYEPTNYGEFIECISLGIEVQNQAIKILNSKNARQQYMEKSFHHIQ